MGLVVDALAALTFLTDISLVFAAIWFIHDRFASEPLSRRTGFGKKWQAFISSRYQELSFLIVLTATSGSIYFSRFLGWEPCRLCWYQRIFMYPLVLIIATALLLDREDVRDYVLPLSLVGAAVAAFHYPMQRIAELQSGCSQFATSCSMSYTMKFGYVTVPMMSLTAFLAVTFLVWRFGPR